MKEVKVFFASSIEEFRYERMDLGDFIRRVTDQTIEQDVYLKFLICEDLSNAVAKERKQEEYNGEIRNSDFLYAVFGGKAGSHTVEELEVAFQHFKHHKRPKLYVYFQRPLEDTVMDETEKILLKQIAREPEICCRSYTHVDGMKLDMLRDFVRENAFRGTVTVDREQVRLNGKKLFSFGNIPVTESGSAGIRS